MSLPLVSTTGTNWFPLQKAILIASCNVAFRVRENNCSFLLITIVCFQLSIGFIVSFYIIDTNVGKLSLF